LFATAGSDVRESATSKSSWSWVLVAGMGQWLISVGVHGWTILIYIVQSLYLAFNSSHGFLINIHGFLIQSYETLTS